MLDALLAALGRGVFLQERDDLRQGRSGAEDARHAHLQQLRHVALRDDPADEDADIFQSRLPEKLQDARHERHVCAAEDAQSEPVRVFVGNGSHDRFGSLPQAGVNDLHSGIAQGAGDDFDAAVVAVEADLGENDTNGSVIGHFATQGNR